MVMWKYVRANPGTAGTLLYGFVSAVGLVSAQTFYRHFDINYLDYADIQDFFTVWISHPSLVVLAAAAMGAVVVPALVLRLVTLGGRHSRTLHRLIPRWLGTTLGRTALSSGCFALYMILHPGLDEGSGGKIDRCEPTWLEREVAAFSIILRSDSDGAAPGVARVRIIGSMSNYLVLFAPATGTATVVAKDDVSRVIRAGKFVPGDCVGQRPSNG